MGIPVLHQKWEESRGLLEGTLPLYGPGALIVRIEESDYHSAAQSLDRNEVFDREFLAVFGEEMSLNVTRTSPLETAEQAVAPLLVYVLPVPCELLCTPKAFAAIGTDSPRLAVHAMSASVLGVLDNHMLSDSRGLSLGCDNLYSDHGKPRDTYPVCRQIGLRPRLNASSKCSRLCTNGVEVQRRRSFIAVIKWCPSLFIRNSCFRD
jgi:hypothetical protein